MIATGQVYERLTVEKQVSRGNRASWRVRCSCGRRKVVLGYNLTNGSTRSCGCLRRELAALVNLVHGHARHGGDRHRDPTWISWRALNQRVAARERYTERGISVCSRWTGPNGYENFLADMGPRPRGRTIDRKDNEGNYSKNNCRWATPKQQANNRRPPRRNLQRKT